MSNIKKLINDFCESGVKFYSIGKIGKQYSGLSGKSKEDFEKGNYKYITYTNIFNNPATQLNVEDYVYIKDGEKQNEIRYKDILIAGSSETLEDSGMISVVTEEPNEKIFLNSFCFGFRLNDEFYDKYNANFLKHLFRDFSFREKIVSCSFGVTRYNLSKDKFLKIKIPCPPIEIQNEIVRILDKFGKLEKELKLELFERRNQFNYWLDKILINENSKKYKLKDVVDLFLGLTYTPTYVESGVKFLSSLNISKDYLCLDNIKYISQEEFNKCTSNAKPKKGDILYVRVGSNLGHPVIYDLDENVCVFVSVGFARVRNKAILNNKYLKYWMASDLFMEQVKAKTLNSPKANLNATWMKEFEIYLPSIDDQNKIVNILEKFDKLIDDVNEGIPAEIDLRRQQYEYYRSNLLTFKEV